jgi:N-acetylglucosaminylphosphatidylinositol deacetylase
MFFGPTILSLTRGGRKDRGGPPALFLLCMSKGNYRNNGDERKEELYKACKVLEIPEQNITVLR